MDLKKQLKPVQQNNELQTEFMVHTHFFSYSKNLVQFIYIVPVHNKCRLRTFYTKKRTIHLKKKAVCIESSLDQSPHQKT